MESASMDHARLIEAVLRNPTNRAIIERLPALGLADAWVVSGAAFQTVWNVLTERPPDYGIKDYDIFYFDADTRSRPRMWSFGAWGPPCLTFAIVSSHVIRHA